MPDINIIELDGDFGSIVVSEEGKLISVRRFIKYAEGVEFIKLVKKTIPSKDRSFGSEWRSLLRQLDVRGCCTLNLEIHQESALRTRWMCKVKNTMAPNNVTLDIPYGTKAFEMFQGLGYMQCVRKEDGGREYFPLTSEEFEIKLANYSVGDLKKLVTEDGELRAE